MIILVGGLTCLWVGVAYWAYQAGYNKGYQTAHNLYWAESRHRRGR